jgi:hypothetical protein
MSFAILAKKPKSVAPSNSAMQAVAASGNLRIGEPNDAFEREADAVAESVMSGSIPERQWSLSKMSIAPAQIIQRRAAPFINKIAVHLSPSPDETAELTWEGTPPSDAPGKDRFTVSTGKGYSDPGDPAGTCKRDCCSDPQKQCASPWNKPEKVGACCTYVGNNFWTGVSQDENNGWKWWTPIQPNYSSRGIALHQHSEVTGKPIGHGCVRMDEPNAKRIHDYSNGRRTNVTIDGTAAPVKCDQDRQCAPPGGKPTGKVGQISEDNDSRIATNEPVAGLEGVMT